MIKISKLEKKFKNKRELNIELLHIEGKGVCGLLGPKGSGKTELLDIISCCTKFEGETISICGFDGVIDAVSIKRKVGYIPQNISFYEEDTVLETLDFVGSAKRVTSDKKYRQIKEALELTHLDGMEKVLVGALPYSSLLRLSIAAALLGNPDIIILDEPMKKLEGNAREELAELILMLGKIKRVIISSDKPSDIEQLCSEFVILKDGKCLLHNTAEEIRSKLNSVRSLDIKLVGDGAKIAEILGGTEGVTKFTYSVNSDRTIEATIEYSASYDRCEEFSGLFKASGYTVISCKSLSLSIADAYYILTRESENKEDKKENSKGKEDK